MINVCVPVLRRYDLLRGMLESAGRGTVQPDSVWVLDNGRNSALVDAAVVGHDFRVIVETPERALGLAESWNWFAKNVPEERVVVNDDVTFAEGSLAAMAEATGPFVTALGGTNAFSCFLWRDECVERAGHFDEAISPGYAYFEDCDYAERMADVGIYFTEVECGVEHARSQTLAVFTPEEQYAHHKKFFIAQENFYKKWGFMPGGRKREKA